MSTPLMSGECAAIVMAGVMLMCAAAVLFGFAMWLTLNVVSAYKSIARDKRLMAACGNDAVTAELVIANAEFARDLIEDQMRIGMQSEFRVRQARVNDWMVP